MLQAMQLHPLSSPSLHACLCSIQPLPQVVQAPSGPSPEATSRKPSGILVTLLNATLTWALSAFYVALLISPSAKAQEKSFPPHRVSRIMVYESSENLHETLQEKPALAFARTRAPHLTITVNDAVKYQEMAGFGASITDSSAWLLSQKL